MKTRTASGHWLLTRFIHWQCGVAGGVALLLWQSLAASGGGVVTNCTEANLRAAMSNGGLVTFACDGTIYLTRTISNTLDTVLDANGHQVTISGSNAVRLFVVASNVQFTALNLTLADGFASAGAAVLNLGGRTTLRGVTLRANLTSPAAPEYWETFLAAGGAVCNRGGLVAATNCVFNGDTAWSWWPFVQSGGGAIHNESGQVDLDRCQFAQNRVFGSSASNPQSMGAGVAGGAVYNSGGLTADFCAFVQNSATAGAGYSGYGTAGGAALGGAVCNSGVLFISRSTFASNNATGGSGGQGYAGGATMEQGLPGGNGGSAGSGGGGAIFNSGMASLVNCTIAVNTGRGGNGGAGGRGSGGYVHWGGNGGDGGSGGNGVGGVDGTCNLTNCTLAWNTGIAGSGGPGGAAGMGQYPGSPGAAGTGGAASGATTYLPMVNSLVASNTPTGNDSFPDPKLGPLADNGGPTLTVALLPGSPAIDAGSAVYTPMTDQRGYPRPAGLATDIGAYEYGSMLPVLTVTKSGGTALDILARGNAGAPCRLQMSANLTDWQCVATNQFGPDGTARFPENCGTSAAHRFYRVDTR